MARVAARRTRSPESEDEPEESRSQTPLSTAPNDRKRARRSLRDHSEPDVSEDDDEGVPAPSQRPSTQQWLGSQPTGPSRDDLHQPGSIVRVKLVNFVTYSNVEFFPGPSLNMVIGPNGTGKSTLVCAICLGLGWGSQYLGRAKDLGDFVKHGASEAQIEIELKRPLPGNKEGIPHRKNHVFHLTIKKDGNKSSFKHNGSPSTHMAVRTLARKFNIQIDNLCQFLPQDKVVEFAQMKPHDVLLSTQQAAGSEAMAHRYEALQTLRAQQKELMGGQRTDRNELENLKKRQESQHTEVQRMREREQHKERRSLLQKLKPVVDYFVAKAERASATDRHEKLAQEVQALKQADGPALRKVNQKKQYMARAESLKKERQTAQGTALKLCEKAGADVAEIDRDIDDIKIEIASNKAQVPPKQQELIAASRKINILKNKHAQRPPPFDASPMTEEITDRTKEINDHKNELRELQDSQNGLQSQVERRERNIREKEQQIKSLDTAAGQQQSFLASLSKDTAAAWEWIQSNSELFDKPVHGPPAVVCKVEDPSMAASVENLLQDGDYRILTAQTQRDYRLLQTKLIEEKGLHDVSLRLRIEESARAYEKPYTQAELRELGFESYAIDFLTGPPAVLATLCQEKSLHLCAIARDPLSTEQHSRLMDSKLGSYIAGNQLQKFVRRKDLGSHATMSQSSYLRPAKIWNKKPVDHSRKAALQRELAESKGELDEAQREFAQCGSKMKIIQEKVAKLQQEVDEIRKEKSEKQKVEAEWNGLPVKIKAAETQVETIKEWIAGARDRRTDCNRRLDEASLLSAMAVKKYADAVHVLKESMADVIKADVILLEAQSDFGTLSSQNEAIKRRLEEAQNAEAEALAALNTLGKQCRQMMPAAKALGDEAQKLSEGGHPAMLDLVKQIGGDKWGQNEWEAEIETVTAQLALTEGGNADAIRQYEERAHQITALEERVAGFDKEVDERRRGIQQVRSEYEPELDKIVDRISRAFGDSFARIGCAGQVEVYKANSTAAEDCTDENGGEDNGLDFANWAIHISVKFREDAPLSILDSHRQSGGERAVSTIFYLMALQSLSKAPFRVVDEINQGMDGRNERMMHGRMVDVATAHRDEGGSGSQYFLITPKLLSGLTYKRGMTVLCIVSGENVPQAGAEVQGDPDMPFKRYPVLDFKVMAAKARELGYDVPPGGGERLGRRVDSGVAMVGA
jgi:structural maintenance of chromosomes protein 5